MADRIDSDLARRLLRRGTHPIGVVDVRPSQERYERAIAWPRQHMALLDRPAARYQVDAQSERGPSLGLASRAVGAAAQFREMASVGGARDLQRAAPSTIAPRGRSAPSGAEAAASASARTTAAHEGEAPNRPTRGEVIAGPAMHAVSRSGIDLPLASRTVSGHTSLEAGPGDSSARRDDQWNAMRGDGRGARAAINDREASTPTSESEVPSEAAHARTPATRPASALAFDLPPAPLQPAHVLVQRRPGTTGERISATTAHTTVQIARAAQPAIGPDTSRMMPESDLWLTRPRVVTTEMPARDTGTGANPATHRAVAETSAPMHAPPGAVAAMDRSSDIDRGPILPLRPVGKGAPAPDDAPRRGPVAPAASTVTVRNGADSMPLQMIWRRGGSPHEGHTTSAASASDSRAARQTPTEPAGAGSTMGGATDAVAATTSSTLAMRGGGEGMDLDRLAEEITRRIVEQGTIERERRGGNQWP